MERITIKQFTTGEWCAGSVNADLGGFTDESFCIVLSNAMQECIEQGVFTREANDAERQYEVEIIREGE
jgi:hypothetical protein